MLKRIAQADPTRVILLAPAIFLLHVLEEAPGFVNWFNSLVKQGISQGMFLRVNAIAFLVTVTVAAMAYFRRSLGSLLVAVAWLGLLMFANGLFHIVGTFVHARYSPGVITASTLYLPYFGWLIWLLRRRFGFPISAALGLSTTAGLPMFIHGYLIVFQGRRLF